MAYLSPTLKLLTDAVKKAANSINRDFSEIERLQSSIKDSSGFVRSAFERVEKNLMFELGKIKPDFPVKKAIDKAAKSSYFVLSQGGVENFAHGLGYFSVGVALMDAFGNPLISVLYSPVMDELYFAEKGNGAYKEGFRNVERLRVSPRKDLKDAIFATNVEYDKLGKNLRIFGDATLELAYLAAGKLDAVVRAENSSASLAVGMLLVKEAGGYVYELGQSDIRSEDWAKVFASKNIMAVNAELGKKVQELLNS